MGNEIEAMGLLDGALTALEPDERGRVLAWAVAKFGDGSTSTGSGSAGGIDKPKGNDTPEENATMTREFDRISDLMDAASPTSGLDYVLLGGYWFQEVQGGESITGQQVNSALKDLGHGSTNITTSFNSLKARKPPHARQIQKSGSSKQGRKQYRLTTEGIRAVERMLAGQDEE